MRGTPPGRRGPPSLPSGPSASCAAAERNEAALQPRRAEGRGRRGLGGPLARSVEPPPAPPPRSGASRRGASAERLRCRSQVSAAAGRPLPDSPGLLRQSPRPSPPAPRCAGRRGTARTARGRRATAAARASPCAEPGAAPRALPAPSLPGAPERSGSLRGGERAHVRPPVRDSGSRAPASAAAFTAAVRG